MKLGVILAALVVAAVNCQRRPPNYSLDEMPRTSFSCRDKIVGGYYADPETDCQMFHVCVRVAGLGVQDFRFLCPNDTSFDQENQICDDWYNIDCEASTLYYSDNFDLYRISEGVPEFGPSRATPIPLGPSSIAPVASQYTKPRRPSHAPVNNAVSEDDDDSYLQKADTGDRRLHKDLLRGSSSGNFFANRNQGKEDPEDDEPQQDYSKNQFGNTQAKKKSSKVAVRKLLTGKRPIQQEASQNQESPSTTTTTTAPVYNNNNNYNPTRTRYNTVQRNRQTTPVPPTESTVNYYQSSPSTYNNNYNSRNNYNQNPSSYQTTTSTPAPVYNANTNNFRSRGNVNYNTYTSKQPEITTNYNNYYESSTTAPYNNYNARNYNQNYNTNNQYQTSTAPPFTNYHQTSNAQTSAKAQNYNQQTQTTSNYYQPQSQSTNNNYYSQYNNNNNNNNYNSQSTATYQHPTTYRTTSNNNNYYQQQNYNNQQQSSTVNYDNYYQTSSTTAAPNNYYNNNNDRTTTYNYYTTTTTTQAPTTAFQSNNNNNYYDKSSTASQSANNYQTKNLYNHNVKAAAAATGPSSTNYDPYNIYNQNNDKYEEPTHGESLKTAPSSNIRPSDLNTFQNYQKQNGFNTTVGTSYNFNSGDVTKTSHKTSYQPAKSSSFTVAVPTKAPVNSAPAAVSYNTKAPNAIPSTKRGNNYYPAPTTVEPQKPRPFSKTDLPPVQPTHSANVKNGNQAAPKPATKTEKDNAYDYAYYDDASPSEYDGFEPVGEDFSRTAARGKRSSIK